MYHVYVKRHYFQGTTAPNANHYTIQGHPQEPLEFETVREALAWIEEDSAGDYVLAHGEVGRPTYRVVDEENTDLIRRIYEDMGLIDWDDCDCDANDGEPCGECETCNEHLSDWCDGIIEREARTGTKIEFRYNACCSGRAGDVHRSIESNDKQELAEWLLSVCNYETGDDNRAEVWTFEAAKESWGDETPQRLLDGFRVSPRVLIVSNNILTEYIPLPEARTEAFYDRIIKELTGCPWGDFDVVVIE